MRLTICDHCDKDIDTAAVHVYASVSVNPESEECSGPLAAENDVHEGCIKAFLQARYPHVLPLPPGWEPES